MSLNRRATLWALTCLCLFSFTMSVLLNRYVFERLPHLEDELAYLYQARILARGQWTVETPQPALAFWQPFVIDRAGQRFGKYPLGWPLMLAVGERLGAVWWINASLGMLAVALVYRLGAGLFRRDVGLIAALLLAFSPMVLLLNASLMGHTLALVCALLFLYSCWRLERGRRPLMWGAVAGAALGVLVANRPVAAAGIALPWVVWSAVRLLFARQRVQVLRPLLLLSLIAVAGAAILPLFSQIAVGDWRVNLYTLVWPYDHLGFGECCGRSGHTLARGFVHLRFDLSLAAADLFGWQIGEVTPAIIEHLRTASDFFPNLGLSWLLLPFGLMAAFGRQMRRLALWMLVGALWAAVGLSDVGASLPAQVWGWGWIGGALLWLYLPLLLWGRAPHSAGLAWRWLLVATTLTLILLHMAYWVGSQRYSTRYWVEGIGGVVLLSALPIAWAAQRWRRVVYGLLLLMTLLSMMQYTLPRLEALHGFNNVSAAWLEAVNARRQTDRPVLVIVSGDTLSWRALGTFMAVTSPFLDSDMIGIYNRTSLSDPDGMRAEIIARFPAHEVIDLSAEGEIARFSSPSASGDGR